MDIKIKLDGFDKLQKNLSNSQSITYSVMKSAIVESVKEIRQKAVDKVPVAEGNLQRSIGQYVQGLVGTVKAGKKYGIYVEEGTKPHWPPIDAIERWARIKLGQEGLGFVIARKISQVGTKAQPFMRPAYESSLGDIKKFFKDALKVLTKEFTK